MASLKPDQIILHLNNVEWEIDYVTKDLLHDYQGSPIASLNKEEYCNLDLWKKEKFRPLIANNIMIFNFLAPYLEIKPVIEYLRPNIIFFMSDEYADCHEYNALSDMTRLFLRQYQISSANTEKIFQIPLGYMKGFTQNLPDFKNSSESCLCKQSKERRINWSFIGAPKSDRQEMLEKFMWSGLGDHYISHNLPASEIYSVYSDSVFVPCGRGNRSLDCFRLYEASVCGAIPVVAGAEEEIRGTFSFNSKPPPWVFAPDWTTAAALCKGLSERPELLNQRQQECIEWWKNINSGIRDKIKTALML